MRNQKRAFSKVRFNIIYLILAIWGIFIFRELWQQSQQIATIPYSEFQSLLKDNQVSEVIVSDNYLRGELKEPRGDRKKQFVTTRVETTLSKELDQYGVKFSRVVENNFFRDVLSWILPVLLFFGIWMYLGRKMAERGGLGGGFLSVGKSKAKIYVETDIKTTFSDVAGTDEAKDELKEIVSFLKNPQTFGRLGARMPKGVLLVGPPGTGKTLLAKAVAGEAAVPFFSISGSEFVEMFVGVGAARVRDLFEQARQKAPCIIFIDELDALGRARSIHPMAGGHDEKEQTLNQLLAELDGFDTKAGVVLLAATNRPEILDPALLRAGRFDRQILVDRPDKKGRLDILKVHVKKVTLAPDTQLEEVAAITPGFTGADIANLVNEAALTATRRNAKEISIQDFTLAIERIVAGLERRNRLLNPLERKTVAFHEMGHALVASALPGCDAVHKISIIPRGIGALGYTIQRPTEDRYLMTKEELINKMTILMGGRSAESLVFDRLSTGAADDLARATEIARSLVTRYGMVEKLGPVTYETDPIGYLGPSPYSLVNKHYSEETSREIDCAVKELMEIANRNARRILEKHRPVLERGADLLLAKETLVESDLLQLFSDIAPKVSFARESTSEFI
ncbi:MAG: ATP-dependent zinc metalloprotease FtsH [Bdellovibrionaceae bacterium]|nr:ATP-dependent zinc metalloprotease FtsH [Pseudobdellovibrionaceae bacterium]